MRVISGKYKGRKFFPPKNLPTRPTTDFAKESLFNIIENHFDIPGLAILDLFCGTGSISYEFASRGSTNITCVDRHNGCVQYIKRTIKALDIPGMKVIKKDVFSYLNSATGSYDMIFADPPYDLDRIPDLPNMVFEKELLKPEGWLIIEHSPKHSFSKHDKLIAERNYGTTIFSIFSA